MMSKAESAESTKRGDMTQETIVNVFETLGLSTDPKPVPTAAPAPGSPLVFFPISGNSPPLAAR